MESALASGAQRATLSELLIEGAAGTVGGVAGIFVGSPFDVIKTRQQLRPGLTVGAAVRELLTLEGPRAFFKGALASSLGQAPNNFLVFLSYAHGRTTLREYRVAERLGVETAAGAENFRVFMAGSYSGLVQSIALAPFERLKVQQQLYRSGTLGMLECARQLVRAQGLRRGLFTGLAATICRDAPTYGLYFLCFERGKYALASATPGDGKPLPAYALLGAGAVAGVLSWSIALPADVIKSTIQGAPATTPAHELRIAHVVRTVHAAHGLRGFFRGMSACLVRAAPVNAVCFLGYESALSNFRAAMA